MELNIYRDASPGLLRKIVAVAAPSTVTDSLRPQEPARQRSWDRTRDRVLISIMQDSRLHGETIAVAFQRKERELAETFAKLDVTEAREMYERLASSEPDDHVAACFARLAAERRERLLSFLLAAPRRSAVRGGSR